MQNDMVERYIYAVARKLPQNIRADVERELRFLVVDMLEERCDGLPPTERDVRVVLAELGTPAELAQKYSPTRGRSLIGPTYYPSYLLLLKIILGCVSLGMMIAGIITFTLHPPASLLGLEVWQWVRMSISVLIHLFAAITLLFIFFERWQIPFYFSMGNDSLNNLPPVPTRRESIPRWEPVVGMMVSILFAIVFLMVPGILGWYFENGVWVTLLNVDAIRSVWYIVLAITLVALAKESVRLYEGCNTRRVALATVIADIISIVLTIWFFNAGWGLNSEFTANIERISGDSGAIVSSVFAHLNQIFFVFMTFFLVLDIGLSVTRAIKGARRPV